AGRTRWLLALVVPGVLGVAVVSFAFGLLVSWYFQPLVDYGDLERLSPSVFLVTGVAVVGWALVAYSAGLLAGVLAGRVVPALAAPLALGTGRAFLATDLRRYHYLAPLETSNPLPNQGDQPVGVWWTHGGVRVTNDQVNQALQAIGVRVGDASGAVAAKPGG